MPDPGPAARADALPAHVAIIMDGNGRWAQGRGRERVDGHRSGLGPVRMVIEECLKAGIPALTLYAFSSENWARPADEVAALMNLFFDALDEELPALQHNSVRLRFIGELGTLGTGLRVRMRSAEALTGPGTKLALQVAVSYGGRQDILTATRALAARCESGELASTAIDEAVFAGELALAGLADPDLFIRTGGELRVSNFLLWNIAYAELYFTETLWPDFSQQDFLAALQDFAGRQRRFGRTAEQSTER
jgi:undecaprenyl diphosphate synthase